jgi:hypothetical protein
MKKFGIYISLGTSLFFILGFFLVNETIWTSIIYGLIAGGSVYYLILWWQNTEKPEAVQEPDFFPFSQDINKVLIKTKLVKPENTKAKQPKRASSILEWFLKADQDPPKK